MAVNLIIFLRPLLVQLVDDLLPTSEYLQRPTLIIVISGLRHQEVRGYRARHHERAHYLQHVSEIFPFPIELLALTLGLESVREENLDEPGA